MRRFAENKALMASKDSKRIVRTYNRVAKALIEFETLWTQAWIRSIESAKAGLQSTLIVRHPTSGAGPKACPVVPEALLSVVVQ